jgi:2-dehydropantoate 2-reductase
MQFLVYGAGAVGSVLGGMLSLNNHEVCLVGREPHVNAIQAEGLCIKSATAEYRAHPAASVNLMPETAARTECVMLGVKSQDLSAALDTLAPALGAEVPVVCIQNGVAAERAVSERFARVYGAVIRMTCSMVQPGHVSFQTGGRLVIGKFPRGSDAFTRSFAGMITAAGFDAVVSKDIMADKWLKLAVNVQSVFHAVIDARDHDTNEFHALKAAIIEETCRVFKKAKIRARSCDERDPSLDDMIETLHRPRAHRTEHGVKVRNSVWQDLYLKRRGMEAEFIHGPVIALGEQHGVATPYNRAALELALRCHREHLGPESLRLSEVMAAVERGGAAH